MVGPFLTLVMRCCKRPSQMAKALKSVLALYDPDVEVVLIPDFRGHGVPWANKQFGLNVDRVDGLYVYTLDDDSRLVEPRMVGMLKAEAAKFLENEGLPPGLVMVKSRRPLILPRVLPKPSVWGKRDKLRVASTNGGCFVSRADVWRKHAHNYGRRGSGDWNYLNAVRRDGSVTFVWLPVVMKEAQQIGRGRLENCKPDWFKRTTRRFGFEQVAPGDWRLPLYRMEASEIKAIKERAGLIKAKKRKRKAPKKQPVVGSVDSDVIEAVVATSWRQQRPSPPRVRVDAPPKPTPQHALLSRRRGEG